MLFPGSDRDESQSLRSIEGRAAKPAEHSTLSGFWAGAKVSKYVGNWYHYIHYLRGPPSTGPFHEKALEFNLD